MTKQQKYQQVWRGQTGLRSIYSGRVALSMPSLDKRMDLFDRPCYVSRPPPNFISPRIIRGSYVFLDLDPLAETDLAVTCAGWEECSPEYEIRRAGLH